MCPSKILGNIIDLLYNIEGNKQVIIQNIFTLMLLTISYMIVRIIWKFFLGVTTRTMEKDLKDKLFEQFLKVNLTSIQNIKNGEIMSYFVKDVGEIRGAFYRILSHGTRILFLFIITIYTMQKVSLSLTIAVMCPISYSLYNNYIKKKSRKEFQKITKIFYQFI